MYAIRDKDGVLKAKVCDKLAYHMMENSEGEHGKANFQNGGVRRIYTFGDNYKFGTDDLRVWVWEGDRLIKEGQT